MSSPHLRASDPETSSRRSTSTSRESIRSLPLSSAKASSEVQSIDSQGGSDANGAPLPAFLKLSHTEMLKKFEDLEWDQNMRIAQGNKDPESGWIHAGEEGDLLRNRYANVFPWANNRVRLKVPEGEGVSDYINASPILHTTAAGAQKKFIATQGPKETSFSHVWRMIYYETADPAVIVMLTQTHEQGREKCFQYFPNTLDEPVMQVNEQDEFNDGFICTVTLLSIQEDPETLSTIREMEIKPTSGEPKKVWHLLFEGWPDFSVPEGEERAAMLKLITLSEQKNTHADSPRVVHCSAGVGRSGSFIALDVLIDELNAGALDNVPDSDDPIFDAVSNLRAQRMLMVQNPSQYQFLYDVLKDLWITRWRDREGASA